MRVRKSREVEPVLADKSQAHLLAIEPGVPLMFLEPMTITRRDTSLPVARNDIPGSRCCCRVNLWPKAPRPS